MADSLRYEYRVERDIWGPRRAEIALVRRTTSHGLRGHLQHHRDHGELVIFHRTFKPRLELDELERYAQQLELVAKHANEGPFGCFVDAHTHDDVVQVTLYERWFDGRHVTMAELARREFDPEDENSLVASAEFVAELETWAERCNDEREMSYLENRVEEAVREERSSERASAANELAWILGKHAR